MSTPAVGRAVHYVSYGTPRGEYLSVCRAAQVAEVGAWMPYSIVADEGELSDGRRTRTRTEVWEPEACALVVSNPTGLFFNTCDHDEGGTSDTPGAPTARSYTPGTWHWPERIGD
jgi:hypothetical protein